MTIFDYEIPRLEIFNITARLRSTNVYLYSFLLDLSAARCDAKELMNAVANAHVRHRWLSHLDAQNLDILRKRDDTGIIFAGVVSDCDVCVVGKAQQLAHPKTAS